MGRCGDRTGISGVWRRLLCARVKSRNGSTAPASSLSTEQVLSDDNGTVIPELKDLFRWETIWDVSDD